MYEEDMMEFLDVIKTYDECIVDPNWIVKDDERVYVESGLTELVDFVMQNDGHPIDSTYEFLIQMYIFKAESVTRLAKKVFSIYSHVAEDIYYSMI